MVFMSIFLHFFVPFSKPLRSGLCLFVCAASLVSCRPADYVPPPQEPSPVTEPQPQEPEDLVHQALYGAELASPRILQIPDEAKPTATGLHQLTLEPGSGKTAPGPDDTVLLHYTAWDAQGRRFEETSSGGQPVRMRMATLAPGLAEGLSTMVKGERRRLWIPSRLAVGISEGRVNGDVVVDVQLVELIAALPAPEVPADLTQPPKEAQRTSSGLVYHVLARGQGERTPAQTDRVLVHYSGWDMNGDLFDSSVMRGEPVAFGVDEVIPGWTEALQLMREGDRFRVWIPAELAYGEQPSAPGLPAGRLCFDVELIQIQ